MNLVRLMGYPLSEEGKVKRSLARWRSLRLSVDQLRLSLYAARAGSWGCDLTTGEAYYSVELCEALGLGPSDACGRNWLERLHPDDRERAEADLHRAISERRDFESEYRVLRPDGGVCWTLSRGWILYDREERPLQMIGLGLDITARKQRELRFEEALPERPR